MTASPRDLDKPRTDLRTIAQVRDLRERADDLLTLDVDNLGIDDAARVLHEIQMARKALQASEEFLIARVHNAWVGDWKTPRHVEGVGVVRPFRGKDRKAWEHEALLHDVVNAHLEDAEGEIPDPFTIAGWVREAAGFAYWKSGALKALGIDPDEYCESQPGRRTVSISTDDVIGDTA